MKIVTPELNLEVYRLKPVDYLIEFREASSIIYGLEGLYIRLGQDLSSFGWVNTSHYPSNFLIQSLNK